MKPTILWGTLPNLYGLVRKRSDCPGLANQGGTAATGQVFYRKHNGKVTGGQDLHASVAYPQAFCLVLLSLWHMTTTTQTHPTAPESTRVHTFKKAAHTGHCTAQATLHTLALRLQ